MAFSSNDVNSVSGMFWNGRETFDPHVIPVHPGFDIPGIDSIFVAPCEMSSRRESEPLHGFDGGSPGNWIFAR